MGKGAHCVDVAFEYNKNAFDGKITSIPQRGSNWVSDNPAGWKVSPFWPLKMPYLIDHYCWVMARRPEMDEKTYDGIAAAPSRPTAAGPPVHGEDPQAWARDKATKLGWKKKH
ncbi:hypothetical protein JL720_16879 [Aureococcus anophagefferens]|nr:hypothetical protein JL720_16879 [Aureococcus anophagefferens]